MLRNGEEILLSPSDIETHVVSFYEELFSSPNTCIDNGLIEEVIPDMVSAEDNLKLTNLPSSEEIKNAVFSMNRDSAPRPDGFGAFFFQKFWDIVEKDVCNAVMQVFQQSWLLPNFNSNLVVLIPKVQGADKVELFKPIALANFKFKIITKVLADRLATVARKIISPNQHGFVQGRKISDCICTASEAINLLNKKSFGGNIALKIDIKKAFDTIDWNFLLKVLHTFGFEPKFTKWIAVILQSAKLSIAVNGNAAGFFSCSRGVRQGDPLSPLLFCLAEEVLSRGITSLVSRGELNLMAGPRGTHVPSHVLYIDDVMIFCKGTQQNLHSLMDLFRRYGEVSGQVINPNKSTFYSGGLSANRQVGMPWVSR